MREHTRASVSCTALMTTYGIQHDPSVTAWCCSSPRADAQPVPSLVTSGKCVWVWPDSWCQAGWFRHRLSQPAATGHNRRSSICWRRAPSSRAKYYSGVVGSLTHTFQWHITHSATTMGRSGCVWAAHLPAPFSCTQAWLKVSYTSL